MGRKCYLDSNGYLRFKDSDILVSHWVAEKKLGRKLRDEEVVHHKDRNKQNNHPGNLWVFRNQEEHDQAHEYDADRFGPDYSYGFDSGVDFDFEDYTMFLGMEWRIQYLVSWSF